MLELRILNGLHQGASLSLDGEDILLGSSLDADIELLDQGIVGRHCAIEYSKTRNQWVLKALDGGLFTASGKRPIKSSAIQENLVVKIGDIYIGFFDTTAPWNLAQYNQPVALTPKERSKSTFFLKKYRYQLGIVGLIGGLVTYSIADDGNTPHGDAALHLPASESVSKPNDPHTISETLQDMLRQRGLLHSVRITQSEKGWILQGQLNDDELATIARMIIRFQDQYPTVVLDNETTAVNRTLPFKIKSISSGLYAHVLTTEGERLYVGDTLKGFTLKQIDKDKVVFAGDTDVELLW